MSPTYTIDQLGLNFPCLTAFLLLNDTLSNTCQSAPSCSSNLTLKQWEGIEAILSQFKAHEFVGMALASNEAYEMLFEKHFPRWCKDWV